MSTVLLQAAVALPAASPGQYVLGLTEVFTVFFVMLGPLKLLGPYAHATASMPPVDARRFALQVTLLATLSVVVGGFLGAAMLGKWHISFEVLLLTSGLIFLLVALQMVLQQYEPASEGAPQTAPPGAVRLVFPLVLTPYGIAAVIALLAISADRARTLLVIAILLVVMLLNLLAMLFAQPIMRRLALPLRVFGAVLGVLQVALALQIMRVALHGMGVL